MSVYRRMHCFGVAAVFCMLAQMIAPISLALPRHTVNAHARSTESDGAAPPQQTQPPAAPESLKPFGEVVKDAEVFPGLFTLYRKDGKALIEILPEQFEQVYLCSPTLDTGLGERFILSASAFDEFAFSFHRQGQSVQLLQKNVHYRAASNLPIHRAVARSFADSILGASTILSQPHPERKSVLVELSDLFVADLPLIGYTLEAEYRLPYRLDQKTSALGTLKSFPQNVELETLLNFTIDRLPVPPVVPAPVPSPPIAPPDARSLTFHVRYSLSKLPESNYQPRLADDRVGYFLTMFEDFSDDKKQTPYVRYIDRWQLEKADPQAALSPPKQPIVFWLENTIPEKYRQVIAEGVLLWNKAFERIGFKDVLVVKQQPDDAAWDAADIRYNTIRWIIATDAGFAEANWSESPFTGQILGADIRVSDGLMRYSYRYAEEVIQPLSSAAESTAEGRTSRFSSRVCNIGAGAAHQAAFAQALMNTRGLMAGPFAEEQLMKEFLTGIIAHEVGHTLGLRHNFRASMYHPLDKVNEARLTTETGLTGSVMDYVPINIAPRGTKQGQYYQTTLGPYDYWAIEYGYKPLAANSPEDELPALRQIAARATEPGLAYGTDEDIYYWEKAPVRIDPRINRFDLGTDPLAYFAMQAKLVHELWDNLETKVGREGEDYQVLRRSFRQGILELVQDALIADKYIGGIEHNRARVGDAGGHLPYEPVPATRQRQALALLNEYVFAEKAFQFSPTMLNKLAIERLGTFENSQRDGRLYLANTPRLDYPIHDQVLALQKAVLDDLLHPLLLARLADLEIKYVNPRDKFTLADLFDGLRQAIWSELSSRSAALEINSFRRALQREHLARLVHFALKPEANAPKDATTLARYHLTELRRVIQRALALHAARMDTMTRAHLEASLDVVDGTLKAQSARAVD